MTKESLHKAVEEAGSMILVVICSLFGGHRWQDAEGQRYRYCLRCNKEGMWR